MKALETATRRAPRDDGAVIGLTSWPSKVDLELAIRWMPLDRVLEMARMREVS
jgi:hypothetical protein